MFLNIYYVFHEKLFCRTLILETSILLSGAFKKVRQYLYNLNVIRLGMINVDKTSKSLFTKLDLVKPLQGVITCLHTVV